MSDKNVEEKVQEKEELKEEFKKADKISTTLLESVKSQISSLKSKILPIEVRCPFCNQTQMSKTIKQKKCSYCDRSFKIIPKTEQSRITNNELHKAHLIQTLYSLENSRKYPQL